MKSAEDLDVFKLAHQLALETYSTTKTFPRPETFGLVDQMRRAAGSLLTSRRKFLGDLGPGSRIISSQRRSSRSRNTTSTSMGPDSGAGSVNMICPFSYLALSIFIRKKFYTIPRAASEP